MTAITYSNYILGGRSSPLFYKERSSPLVYGPLVSRCLLGHTGFVYVLFVFHSGAFYHRDGPDQSSPQIGQFSGNTALESVYSTSNIILIKFHSDFSGAGFFVLSYHGKKETTLSQR